ncbi:hypothetical protein DICVIV_10197, partial [Dictyocaulus viviparus]
CVNMVHRAEPFRNPACSRACSSSSLLPILESGNELLNSFKYANFSINEEQDVAAAAQHSVSALNNSGEKETDWDEIIPAAERQKLEEEERRKFVADLELAPRQRARLEIEEAFVDDDYESDGDAENSGRKKRKKAFGEFSAVEVKRFVRSFKKFARPLQRLEAVAQDAELEEHSADEVKKLAEALLDGCEKAEQKYSMKKHEMDSDKNVKDRGPAFKFFGIVDVNVRLIRKLHSELEPLHRALVHQASSNFKPPVKTRPQKGWDVEWALMDDSALLRGVFKYGIGSWEAIKMDPELGLADKIFIKDKVRKPQPRHLQQRVDYLLKLMNKEENETRKNSVIQTSTRKRKAFDTGKNTPSEEKRRREKEDSHRHHRQQSHTPYFCAPGEKTIADQLALVAIEKSIYGQALENTKDRPFSECVRMMRPVQKYIKKLAEATSEREETKYLIRLGDNCRSQIDELLKRRPKTNVRKWYNYMWIFLSKFVPQEPLEMVEKYRELCALNNRHKHREHHHIQKDHTPPKHDTDKKKDNESHKKNDDDHHRKKHHHKDHKFHKEDQPRKYKTHKSPHGSPYVRLGSIICGMW